MIRRTCNCVLGLLLLCLLGLPYTLLAQDGALVVNQPHSGDVVVTGKGSPGSIPVTIFDTSFDAPAALGSGSSMDAEGNYAVSVDPPLIEGHTIMAEDAEGRTSPNVSVSRPSSAAAGP